MDAHPQDANANQGSHEDVTIVTLLGLLAALTACSAWRSSSPAGVTLEPTTVRRGVDPNTAPWWELTALPEVGESTARRIVAYREAHADRAPVFREPPDLEPVPDIGPKTIQRIAPHLRFEE